MSIYFLGPINNKVTGRVFKNQLMDIIIFNKSQKTVDVLVEGVSGNRKFYQSLRSVSPGMSINFENINVSYDVFTFQISTTSLLPNAVNVTVAGKINNQQISNYYTDQIKVIE